MDDEDQTQDQDQNQDQDQDQGGFDADLEIGDTEVEENDDGSAVVSVLIPDATKNAEFYSNLAEEAIPEQELNVISQTLLELIERDKESRKLRDKQYEEGLRRTGLGGDAPGGANFQGASKVVHPMLTEACVDYSSRVIKEIFPPNGPVKEFIPGDVTVDKLQKADRKQKFMNWQLTQQMVEFRSELEQTQTQVPLGGVQYMKLFWDEDKARPVAMFIPIDDIYLPYSATSFHSAERKTHAQNLTKFAFEKRVNSGFYRDINLSTAHEPDLTAPEKANQKIEGKEATSYNEDGLRTVFEVSCYLDIEDNFGLAPYLVSIDESTRKVVALYRNWDPDDQQQQELQHIIEFPFVPWRGAYPIGLPHMIGSLSAAATGALRGLLDSAHINNFPGMLKLKGGSRGGQSDRIEPTQVTEIDAPVGVDDIRKIAMPIPFNPPNSVLFNLLGFVTDAAKGVVRTTFEDLQQASPNQPVGTTMALIEQGMTVFSAIHARQHAAMANLLRILHRINAKHLDDKYIRDVTGEQMVYTSDFEGPIDVVPVSDPNIFSEAQRIAQMQAIMQRADAHPQLYDQTKVEQMFLERTKVPNATDLLNKKPEPQELNAVNENIALTLGRPTAAFPEQDHLAHLQVHLDFLKSPMFGSSALMAPTLIPGMLQHVKEHLVLWYARSLYEAASQAAGAPLEELMEKKDPEIASEMDKTLAMASRAYMPKIEQSIQGIPPVIQQAMQVMQQFAPKPPQDPTTVLMAETQRKAAADKATAQNNQQKIMIEQQKNQIDAEQVRMKQQQDTADIQAKLMINQEDNQSAKELAVFEAEQGQKSNLRTGHGLSTHHGI